MSKWYEWVFPIVGSAAKKAIEMKNANESGDYSAFGSDIPDPSLNESENGYAGLRSAFSGVKRWWNSNVVPTAEKFINNVTGERDTQENQKNRDFQSDEAQIARDWQAEQAQIAREWDTIGAQMERAVAAGVNPVSIAMQNGGINSSATSPMPSSPGIPAGSSGLMHNGIFDIASAIFGGIGTLAENRLKQTQSDDIVAMRQYNIAEKIANTDHIKQLCRGVELSNSAQYIQNQWLDMMNQATYDGMLLENGVRYETILEKRSIQKVNLVTYNQIYQDTELALKKFNATLPLELQLLESDIDFKRMSTKELYEEVCLRHLQAIEQESRNVQAAAEASSAETSASLAKATFEDAINAFHNDMVAGAARAGISLNDYMYYSVKPGNLANLPGYAATKVGSWFRSKKRKPEYQVNKQVQGLR